MNKVILHGYIGRTPETRKTQNGKSITTFRFATNKIYYDKDRSEWQQTTEWHNIESWNLSDKLIDFLRNGTQLLLEGELRTEVYEKNGEKRYKTKIVTKNIALCGKKEGSGTTDTQFDEKTVNGDDDYDIPF